MGSAKAQKEGKSESELDEMWWKQAGELVAGYYKQREEVEKDVEGVEPNSFAGEFFGGCLWKKGKSQVDWGDVPGRF